MKMTVTLDTFERAITKRIARLEGLNRHLMMRLADDRVPPPRAETRGQAETRRKLAHLATMHARHGLAAKGVCCRDCSHLVRVQHGGTKALKCRRFGISHSEATDWRAKWAACGLSATFRLPTTHPLL